MARLILSLDSQVLAEYNMSKERYTIGRLPDNDVRIDNPAVSGHHSLIINILNDSFLEDLNSTNGTYVNGKLIKKHALQNGDVITIGHHQLRFTDEPANDSEQDEFEKTMVIPAGQQSADQLAKAEAAADEAAAARAEDDRDDDERDDLKVEMPEEREPEEERYAPSHERLEEEPVAEEADTAEAEADADADPHGATTAGVDPSVTPSALPLAKLQVLSGAFAGRELELTKALTTLGRPGVQVAAITRRKEGYFVVHVESGEEGDFPLVNGQPIGAQARKLSDNDVVQIAGVKMGFFAS
ncbi:MAG: FHA domain-containing protein [Pseudomonadota bacterium]